MLTKPSLADASHRREERKLIHMLAYVYLCDGLWYSRLGLITVRRV